MAVQVKSAHGPAVPPPSGDLGDALRAYLAHPEAAPPSKPVGYLVEVGNAQWIVEPAELSTFLQEHASDEGLAPMIVPLGADERARAVGGAAGPMTAPQTTNVPGVATGALQPGVEQDPTGRYQLSREARLAAIVTEAQRADRDPSKLAASLARPLVGHTENGQVVPYAFERPSPRPWGEMSPTRTVVSYSEDDVIEPATWGSPEKVGRLQHRLVNAGFLAGDFQYGFYDESTEAAYRDLLTFSSKNGMSMIEGLVEAHAARRWAAKQGVPWSAVGGAEGGGLAPSTIPKYQAPDKASVRQTIKAQFKAELGRDPERGELARYAARYLADDREDFDAQVDAATPRPADIPKNVFDEAPSLVAAETGEEASAADAPDRVDPAARFAEAFERRFAGEMDFKERQATNAAQTSLLGGILGSIDEVA